MQKIILFIILAILALLLFSVLAIFQAGCSSSDGPEESGFSITLTPNSLDFDSTLTQMVFNITSSSNSESAWNATDTSTWISLGSTSGIISKEIDQVSVSIDRTDLDPGSYAGTVTVTSGDGSSTIPITMSVPVSQTLAVSHKKLIFRTHLTNLSFNLTNAGLGTVTWSISNNQGWLTLSSASGSSTTEADTIGAVASRSGLEPGDYFDTVSITSDGGNVEILALMTVPELFENGTEYFPMADGDTWYYTWADSAKTIKREVSGDTVINGITCARILENDSTVQAWSKVADSFYVHLMVGEFKFRFDPALAIPFNLEEGITYNYLSNIYFQDQAEPYFAAGSLDFIGYVSKTVPAGQFNDVIKLYYQPVGESNYYEYYARGVGLLDNEDYILDSAKIDGVWFR